MAQGTAAPPCECCCNHAHHKHRTKRRMKVYSMDGPIWIVTTALVLLSSVTGTHAVNTQEVLPRFTVEPLSQVVRHEEKVVLRCHTEPSHAPITWLYNGMPLTSDPEAGVEVEGGRLHIASFRHRPKDSTHIGVYQCMANSSVGVVLSKEAYLERAYMGQFSGELRDRTITVPHGNVALIPCNPPEGNPQSLTLFEVNGNTIGPETSSRYQILPSGNLQIEGVKSTDEGVYRCIAYNPVTGQRKMAPNSVHLQVDSPRANNQSRFVQAPKKNVDVILGRNLTLECVVEGSPVPRVTWNKYGGQLPDGRYRQLLGNLIIYNVELYDEGTYICYAENDIGSPQASIAMVTVLEPPEIKGPPRDIASPEGSTVILQCLTRGKPKVRTEWRHNGLKLQDSERTIITDTTLTLENLRPSQSGAYQCFAHNPLGVAYATARLHVTGQGQDQGSEVKAAKEGFVSSQSEMQHIAPHTLTPPSPKIIRPPSNTTAPEGSTILLPCATSDPTHLQQSAQIQWQKNKLPFAYAVYNEEAASKGGSGFHFDSNWLLYPNGSLLIKALRPIDEGLYTCIATLNDDFDMAEAYIHILKDWPSIEEPSSEEPHGHEAQTQLPHEPITEEGGRVKGRGKKKGRGQSQERGRDREDRPNKKNKSRNRGSSGNGDKKNGDPAKLVPPSRPRVSKLSDTSVMLEWNVEDNDGLAINFFKVQYKEITDDGRKSRWRTIDEDIMDTARRHEVAGLKPGGTYRFRVLAVYSNNDNKQGPNSAKFTLETVPMLRPKEPMRAPLIVKAKALSVNTISLTWQYVPDEVPIEGFRIYYGIFKDNAKPDFDNIPLLGSSLRTYVLTNLQPDTYYVMKIRSFNTAGESADSMEVSQKTMSYTDPAVVVDPNPKVHKGDGHSGITMTTRHPDEEEHKYPTTRISTQSSSQLLYMVLGIVLGIMMLLLVVFMVMCAWKQRQQRRMMAAIEGRHKFHNCSQTIHLDSMRKKQQEINGTQFLLNGLNGVNTFPQAGNGHIPQYLDQPINGTLPNQMNINVNPMTGENEDRAEDMEPQSTDSIQELRASLQEILPAGPILPARQHAQEPPSYQDASNSLLRHGQYPSSSSQVGGQTYNPPTSSFPTVHKPQPQHGDSLHSLRSSSDRLPNRSLDGNMSTPHNNRLSPDHIPRSHERLHYRPAPGVLEKERERASSSPHDAGGRGSDQQLSEHSHHSSSSAQSQVNSKANRRKRRPPVVPVAAADFNVRDQATNTDLSSNEGTLDSHPPNLHTYETLEPSADSIVVEEEEDCHSCHSSCSSSSASFSGSPPPLSPMGGEDGFHERSALMSGLDRAQDYSASEHEDLDG